MHHLLDTLGVYLALVERFPGESGGYIDQNGMIFGLRYGTEENVTFVPGHQVPLGNWISFHTHPKPGLYGIHSPTDIFSLFHAYIVSERAIYGSAVVHPYGVALMQIIKTPHDKPIKWSSIDQGNQIKQVQGLQERYQSLFQGFIGDLHGLDYMDEDFRLTSFRLVHEHATRFNRMLDEACKESGIYGISLHLECFPWQSSNS